MVKIDFSTFSDPGLYLLWSDGNRLALTLPHIEECTHQMLDDPQRIPASVRAAAVYAPCDICPERDRAIICHAIKPVLPFIRDVDHCMSYDRVTAVYREVDSDMLSVVETSMQDALRFVCLLSLMQYCEVGRQYAGYFAGVNPLLPASDIAAAVYRNLFEEADGDQNVIAATIQTMSKELLHTTRCQAERVRLVCKQDAFVNAYVATYTVVQLLFEKLEHHRSKHLASPATIMERN